MKRTFFTLHNRLPYEESAAYLRHRTYRGTHRIVSNQLLRQRLWRHRPRNTQNAFNIYFRVCDAVTRSTCISRSSSAKTNYDSTIFAVTERLGQARQKRESRIGRLCHLLTPAP